MQQQRPQQPRPLVHKAPQQLQQQPRPEAPPAWKPTVPWVAPESVALQSVRPASGEQSKEAARQRARNLQQVDCLLPEPL
jgi:hypothetical protein